MQVSRPTPTPSGQPATPRPVRLLRDVAVCAAPIAATMGSMSLSVGARMGHPWVVAATGGAMLAGSALVNASRGQPAWCACDRMVPLALSVNDAHTSQHWFDAYTLTHALHGMVGYGVMSRLPVATPMAGKVVAMCAAAVGWEIAENAPSMVDRYRRNNVARGYRGDSVANSLTDVAACMAGFALAQRAPVVATVALGLAVEVGLAATVRDNLSLCILMMLHPVDAVRRWQARRPTWT